jgi:hypothetical protein
MATVAEQVVAKIEAAIVANPLAEQISLDGHSVSMPEALRKLEYWRRRAAREAGGRPVVSTLDLSGC